MCTAYLLLFITKGHVFRMEFPFQVMHIGPVNTDFAMLNYLIKLEQQPNSSTNIKQKGVL